MRPSRGDHPEPAVEKDTMPEDMIKWLYDLRHFGIKLGLDNIRALLEILGHPERAYRSIHIAGTNGKGSVAAMLDATLAAHGIRSGLFTSPHLVRPNERIRIAGRDIESDELHTRLARIREKIEAARNDGRLEAHPSFFEVMTGTALQSFKEHHLDAAVLEVGLGGRLDATNAVEPEVCVIVSVDLDHTKTLGGTLEKIAAEKAGIIKPGRPVISGVVRQRAIDVLQDVCFERGADYVDARTAVRLVAEDEDGFTLKTARGVYPGLRSGLVGRHQVDNARIALAALEPFLERLGREPSPEAVRAGLASVRWAGRLQRVAGRDGIPDLLLDAAHNPAGMETLIDFLEHADPPPAVVVFGATSGKPFDRLLEPLGRFARTALITCPPVDRGMDAGAMADLARPYFDHVETLPKPAAALQRAAELVRPGEYALVTGSLYLIGHVLGLVAGEAEPDPVAM